MISFRAKLVASPQLATSPTSLLAPVPRRVPTSTVRLHQQRRRCYASNAADFQSRDAQRTLKRILDLLLQRQFDKVVDYLANDAIAGAPTLHLSKDEETVVFTAVMENMLLESPCNHFLDSCAIRNLLHSTPAQIQPLSSLLVPPNKYIHRCGIMAQSGEESVLTLTLSSTVPPDQPQPEPSTPNLNAVDSLLLSKPQRIAATPMDHNKESSTAIPPPTASQSGSDRVIWKLRSIHGEPMHAVLPTTHSPEFSPESVVEAQLEALRRLDLASAYLLLSPTSQSIVGPPPRFAANLRRHPQYRVLKIGRAHV